MTHEGLYCIRFGLVTADTDLEELIGMVVATGKDVEESSKVNHLESCSTSKVLGDILRYLKRSVVLLPKLKVNEIGVMIKVEI